MLLKRTKCPKNHGVQQHTLHFQGCRFMPKPETFQRQTTQNLKMDAWMHWKKLVRELTFPTTRDVFCKFFETKREPFANDMAVREDSFEISKWRLFLGWGKFQGGDLFRKWFDRNAPSLKFQGSRWNMINFFAQFRWRSAGLSFIMLHVCLCFFWAGGWYFRIRTTHPGCWLVANKGLIQTSKCWWNLGADEHSHPGRAISGVIDSPAKKASFLSEV